jgi:hypothetical protein
MVESPSSRNQELLRLKIVAESNAAILTRGRTALSMTAVHIEPRSRFCDRFSLDIVRESSIVVGKEVSFFWTEY